MNEPSGVGRPPGASPSRARQGPSALPVRMLHVAQGGREVPSDPKPPVPMHIPSGWESWGGGVVCPNSASPKSRRFQGWVLPGQPPLPQSLKPCSKKGTNLGPKLAHINPSQALRGGPAPSGSNPQGRVPRQRLAGVTPSPPSPHAFSSLEPFLNWVLIMGISIPVPGT